MFNLWRAEILKVRSLRLVRIITFAPLVLSLALSALVIVLRSLGVEFGNVPERVEGVTPEIGRGLFALSGALVLVGLGGLYALALVLVGGLITANEYTWTTVKMVAIREPSRLRLVLAKALLLLSYAILMLVIFIISWFIYAIALQFAYNQPLLSFSAADSDAIPKGLYYIALAFLLHLVWGWLGLALGLQFKSVIAAVILYLVYSFIDNAASSLGANALNAQAGLNLPNWLETVVNLCKFIAPFLLNTNFQRLTGQPGQPTYLASISPLQATIVLLAWGVLFILLAFQVFRSRDITD